MSIGVSQVGVTLLPFFLTYFFYHHHVREMNSKARDGMGIRRMKENMFSIENMARSGIYSLGSKRYELESMDGQRNGIWILQDGNVCYSIGE